MADEKHAVVEGDGSKVPVQLAPGTAQPGEAPQRPSKGTHLVFGGKDPQSPWGQIASLVGEGAKVPYTLVNAAVLAKGQAQGKKPGSGGKPKEEKKKEEKPEDQSPEIHPAAVDEIFMRGEEFKYREQPARVWAHPETPSLGPRPLVVYLHGIQRPKGKPYPQLQEHIDIDNLVHVGMLAKALVDHHNVEPLIIAAPTCKTDSGSKVLWLPEDFDLGEFIDGLRPVLENHDLEIDDAQVAVVGHSGAGCNAPHKTDHKNYPTGGGLIHIALTGGKFGDKPLKVFGMCDTCITSGSIDSISKGLKKFDPATTVFCMHQGVGGAGDKNTYIGAEALAKSLGAPHLHKSPAYRPGEGSELSDYRDDVPDGSDAEPRRISLKMVDHAVWSNQQVWYDSHAAKKGTSMWPHYAMTLQWTWYALQRFYQRVSPKPEAGPDPAAELAKSHKAPIEAAGDDWQEVPEGPPPWKAPAERPRANAPSRPADPVSGRFWPVRTHSVYGRAVAYVGEEGGLFGGGPAADPTAQRNFLAPRETAQGDWLNAGVDLYADFGDTVVASEQGVISTFDQLWPGVFRMLVHCSSGMVICYGGLDPDSMTRLGLKVGDQVKAGQPIGTVGRPDDGRAMLHFETYPQGTRGPVTIWESNLSARDKVLDPTAYLLALAKLGQ
jgi:murein DD-endopeptidase MepM/ murein hydrolase activator NlpD